MAAGTAGPTRAQESAVRRGLKAGVLTLMYGATLVLLASHALRETALGGDPWKQADWLISNAAGPVRRGLSGSALLAVSDASGLRPDVVAAILQAGLTAFVFAAVLAAAWRMRLPDRVFLLLISPGFLLFWAYAPQAAMRKEVLVYAAFALLLLRAVRGWRGTLPVTGAVAIYGAGVLAHEGLVFFAPFLVLMIHVSSPAPMPRAQLVAAGAAVVAVSAGGLGWALLFPSAAPQEVCAPLLARGLAPGFCDGAIAALGSGLSEEMARSRAMLTTGEAAWFAAYYALAVGPILLLWPELRRPRARLLMVACGGLAFLPLYAVAIDWGRWISFYVVALGFLLLAWQVRGPAPQPPLPPVRFALLLAVALSWSMPDTGGGWQGGGIELLPRFTVRAVSQAAEALGPAAPSPARP